VSETDADAAPERTAPDGPGPASDDAFWQGLFASFADEAVARLPLYRRLCQGVAEDPEVARRLTLARPGQAIPNLLLAAVHDVLLAGEDHPLGAWYASVVPHPRHVGTGDDDPYPHFRDLALHDAGVEDRLRSRATQTNEVGRSLALLPAFSAISLDAPGAPPDGGRPLGLVEVGASAGLNLLLDGYGYRYQPGDHVVGRSSLLTLECTLRGGLVPPIPAAPPTIASRIGLDLHPVDLHDRDQSRWLVACQWPDQPERVHRARTAIALAHGRVPTVVRGDAVDDLAPLVEAVGAHALPVVFATWVLSYLPEARQAALVAVLDGIGAHRDLSFVWCDHPRWVPGLPGPGRPDGGVDSGASALVRVDWRDGVRTASRLADLHPHGTWMEWLQA
jgi:hypothetical protein